LADLIETRFEDAVVVQSAHGVLRERDETTRASRHPT
jgi:hypothetical protein